MSYRSGSSYYSSASGNVEPWDSASRTSSRSSATLHLNPGTNDRAWWDHGSQSSRASNASSRSSRNILAWQQGLSGARDGSSQASSQRSGHSSRSSRPSEYSGGYRGALSTIYGNNRLQNTSEYSGASQASTTSGRSYASDSTIRPYHESRSDRSEQDGQHRLLGVAGGHRRSNDSHRDNRSDYTVYSDRSSQSDRHYHDDRSRYSDRSTTSSRPSHRSSWQHHNPGPYSPWSSYDNSRSDVIRDSSGREVYSVSERSSGRLR